MKRILVYGASLFLAGLLAQLQALPDVEIDSREALTDLGDLSAYDAVLIDLNDARAADVPALLRARPDLRVVGVNAVTVQDFAARGAGLATLAVIPLAVLGAVLVLRRRQR